MGADTGRLTKAMVEALQPPEQGNRITYDQGKGAVSGFGVRVTAKGKKAFVLNYVIAGRERRMTIGGYPTWEVTAAREEAKELRQRVDRGEDPLGEREAIREAPTIAELCDRYLAEHAIKKRTMKVDEAQIRRVVLPELGNRKVASIGFADIDKLHRKVTMERGPIAANRALALLSKAFRLAIRWEMRSDNPVVGVERNQEHKRGRYLSGDEMGRLAEALTTIQSRQGANVIRLLLLTGARKGEVLGAAWDQFDLEAGIWTKPAAATKQKRLHRVPLSAPARMLLAQIWTAQNPPSPWVFPGKDGAGPMARIETSWSSLRKAAGLDGLRVHDLRHNYASVLVSSGLSLPVIGALLGHTQAATTQRYSHLFDDPLRAATERAGAIITGAATDKASAEVVPIRGGSR